MEQGFEKEYVGDNHSSALIYSAGTFDPLVVELLPCLRHSFPKLCYHTNQPAYVTIHCVTSSVYLTSSCLTKLTD